MANLQYASEILDDILTRAGETTSGNSKYETRAIIYLNRAYRSLADGGLEFDKNSIRDWWWLYAQGNIILQPVRTTGTVAVTQNSSSITFSSAPVTSVAGQYFKVDNFADVFKVSTHTGGAAAAVLDSVYTGDTNATATYKLMTLEYDLAADFARLISPMKAYQSPECRIHSISQREMDQEYPLNRMQAGVPNAFTFMDSNTVRFNRYGDDDGDYIRLDYDYIRTTTDLTDAQVEPLMPLRYRHVLADIALYFLLFDKEDPKTEGILAQAKAGLLAMKAEQDARASRSGTPGQIRPRGRWPTRRLESTSGIIYDR
jgi:hypothetical protein